MKQHKTLYITNGDSAVGGLKAAGFTGDFLPIRDPLHIGPLLAEDDFISDDSPRCQFIIEQRWVPSEKVLKFQKERRETLTRIHQYDSIQLWFEHDLYDQLQLLWVLTFLSTNKVNPNKVKLIVTDLFLGYAYEADFFELLRFQETADLNHYKMAVAGWQKLTSSNPNDMIELVHNQDERFPFLPAAITRFCQEFPSSENGLGLTAQKILEMSKEPINIGALFKLVQAQESAAFMGDTLFYDVIAQLAHSSFPLLDITEHDHTTIQFNQVVRISGHGSEVVSNHKHYLDHVDADFWQSGVHIKKGNLWCYNHLEQKFSRRTL